MVLPGYRVTLLDLVQLCTTGRHSELWFDRLTTNRGLMGTVRPELVEGQITQRDCS